MSRNFQRFLVRSICQGEQADFNFPERTLTWKDQTTLLHTKAYLSLAALGWDFASLQGTVYLPNLPVPGTKLKNVCSDSKFSLFLTQCVFRFSKLVDI